MKPILWAAVDEVVATGLGPTVVSKARRKPTHPANGPDCEVVIVGATTSVKAPADDIIRWWLTEIDRPGKPGPRLPGVVVTQIKHLAAERGITTDTAQTQETSDA